LIGIALPSYCIQQRISQHLLAALQIRKDTVASGIPPNPRYLLAQSERDTKPPQVVEERLGDFPDYKVQNDCELIDEHYIYPTSLQKGRVRKVDDAYATDDV